MAASAPRFSASKIGCWFSLAVLILLLIAAILIAGLLLFGGRQWSKTQAELQQKGERLFLVELAPEPIPDEENFFAAPVWKPLIDGQTNSVHSEPPESGRKKPLEIFSELVSRSRGGERKPAEKRGLRPRIDLKQAAQALHPEAADLDETAAGKWVLQSLDEAAAELAAIEEAAKRPSARFPAQYEKGFAAKATHWIEMLKIAQYLQLRSVAEMAAGESAAALAHLELLFKLADFGKKEPALIGQLVRLSILQMATSVIWEGLARKAWSAADLIQIQERLSRQDLEPTLRQVWRGERGALNQTLAPLLTSRKSGQLINELTALSGSKGDYPALLAGTIDPFLRGWVSVDLAYSNDLFQRLIENGSSWETAGYWSEQIQPELERLSGSPQRLRHLLTLLALPAVGGCVSKFQQAETSLRQAQIACALERYRQARGSLPDALSQLAPEYLSKLPLDVCGQGDFRYRLLSPDRFELWSIGPDRIDNNGTPAPSKSKPVGDWLWPALPE